MRTDPKHVVFDCDSGPDDAANIALHELILPHETAAVVTSFGCGPIERTTSNTAAFLDVMGLGNVPLLEGAANPRGFHPNVEANTPLPHFFGDDAFNNLHLPPSRRKIETENTIETLAGILEEIGVSDYMLTGPASNLAALLDYDESLIRRSIRRVYMMGGALGAGNSGVVDPATGVGRAEFNFFLDAESANKVLTSDLPITLVTWDEAKRFSFPKSTIDGLAPGNAAGEVLAKAMHSFFAIYATDTLTDAEKADQQEPSLILSDPLTSLARAGLGSVERRLVRVETRGDDYGRLIEDVHGHPVDLFHLTDVSEALSLLLQAIERR